MNRILLVLLSTFLLTSCATIKHKDIAYITSETATNATLLNIETDKGIPKLNIFTRKNISEVKKPVLLFVYGGNWNSGSKDMYGFLGRNFAKHDVVAVLPNYTLSPDASYDTMAQQVAAAIKWTQQNIEAYGGDASQIYLTGHSAGGHLISLATLNPKYGIDPATISGIILNDAAALDMKNYLEEVPPTEVNNYITTWTKDPKNWKDASPIYFLNDKSPPFKIYLGSKTYPSITVSNKSFLKELNKYQPDVKFEILNKKHAPMVTQYIWPWSKRYDEIVAFINKNNK